MHKRKLLILYPHWPPSNLAGVHRPRLIANFMDQLGWDVTVLTVDHTFYDESPDWDMCKLVNPAVQVYYTRARPVKSKRRWIGDIGIRAFRYLEKEGRKLIEEQKPDFLWIPIPSFYAALLGRRLHDQTGIPYGIDYIDPWVDGFTDARKRLSKGWLSNQVARVLEPYAVRKASLISGVSEAYYMPVIERNFPKGVTHVAMPYGFDPHDHQVEKEGVEFPWSKDEKVVPVVYAGAFLPKSHYFMDLFWKVLSRLKDSGQLPPNWHFYFLGTGAYTGKSIADYAADHRMNDHVTEIRTRFPFLDIQAMLRNAAGVLVIGSTERHYTASKTFQSLLSRKPVFAIFHEASSAAAIMKECNADAYLVEYKENENAEPFTTRLEQGLLAYCQRTHTWNPDLKALDKYSSLQSAKALVDAMDRVLGATGKNPATASNKVEAIHGA
ncbi:MAG: hypothetical protein H6585_04415 [Flavobacteriales bacterium]|nr:hypothetical protein [Flavobacteriales bacterium]MCB9447570.1 hypothetical protein [Flavobacteriales bacterium]